MAQSARQSPILTLLELEQRSKQYAHSLPQQIEVKTTWDGVGFRLGEYTLVAPMEQVREILTQVTISRIPGAKEWVKGVANVRGNLLPILDLNGFVFGKVAKMNRRSRVLVIQHNGITAGLVVNEVLGMRHFLDEEFDREPPQVAAELQRMLDGGFHQRGEVWGVFDIHRLAEMPEFMQVAA